MFWVNDGDRKGEQENSLRIVFNEKEQDEYSLHTWPGSTGADVDPSPLLFQRRGIISFFPRDAEKKKRKANNNMHSTE
jgi:hypothetical protein